METRVDEDEFGGGAVRGSEEGVRYTEDVTWSKVVGSGAGSRLQYNSTSSSSPYISSHVSCLGLGAPEVLSLLRYSAPSCVQYLYSMAST